MVMEDSTKAAIVQQHRATVIGSADSVVVDTPIISPNTDPEVTILNNNNNTNAVTMSPSVSPTSNTGGSVAPNQNVYLIGLEFVRQYYTVLHQGPLYLHRFYSEQSSFVHDDSKVVYGQQDIRDRIEQLNFRNCVAKILQVDSQETLGNGVVIQVRGELSNNGKPLRRFMQTFVLAPQTPKRYYVRNDIFHYQDDENFKDDLNACLDSTHLSNEHVGEDERSEEDEGQNDAGSHVPSVSAGSPTSVNEAPIVNTPPKQPEVPPTSVEPVDAQVPEVSLLDTKVEPAKDEMQQRRPSHGFVGSGAGVSGSDNVGFGGRGPEHGKEPDQGPPVGGGSVKTYANLFKSDLNNPTASGGTREFTSRSPFPLKPSSTGGRLGPSPTSSSAEATAGDVGNNSVSPGAVSPQPPHPHPSGDNNSGKNLPPRGHNNYGRGGFNNYPRWRRDRLPSRSSNTPSNDDTGSVDGDKDNSRRPIHIYPDSHQLFVGNLPHTVTIEEVKGIFEVFGRVAEVKILRPNQKSAGPKVPYFCFVVFEEQSSAEAAIRDKSKISMKMYDGSHRRLNVEEKKKKRP